MPKNYERVYLKERHQRRYYQENYEKLEKRCKELEKALKECHEACIEKDKQILTLEGKIKF